jgi:hypothetical protein
VNQRIRLRRWWLFQVLFLVFSCRFVFVTEDEMDLIVLAAAVGTEHNNVPRFVAERCGREIVIAEEFDVRTTAFHGVLVTDFILKDECFLAQIEGRREFGREAVERPVRCHVNHLFARDSLRFVRFFNFPLTGAIRDSGKLPIDRPIIIIERLEMEIWAFWIQWNGFILFGCG